MINQKTKKISAIIILFIVILRIATCGELNWKGKEKERVRGPHEPTEPVIFDSYPEMTKVSFRETFGQYFQVEAAVTKDTIEYMCFVQDILGEEEPEIIQVKFDCGQQAWDRIVSIFAKNDVGNWKEKGFFLNKYFNQQATLFEEWPQVEFARTGNFFNIAAPAMFWSMARPPHYYGIDQNEAKFRSDYDGYVRLYMDDSDSPYIQRSYESFGLPMEYHQFQREFWDFIVGYTGIYDWRYELDDWGRESLYKKFPYMRSDGQDRQIRYFSLLESYGGRNSAEAAILVYDMGQGSLSYESGGPGKVYSVGRSGEPVLYCEKQPDGKPVKGTKEVSGLPEELREILERYQVDMWETEPEGTEYVRQGEFYNAENGKQVKDKNEQAFRSSYDALIHVVYTNGDHTEVWLENGKLPESYNDFRDELWDYVIPFVNEGQNEEEQAADWRDFIDEWGEKDMGYLYPYMR